jgi:hypothetical protein
MVEQDQFLVSLLMEDFKARWQELLNTSGEISTWTTIYYSALVITIAWVLGRKGKQGIRDLFVSDNIVNASLAISLALVNVVYILGISIRTYQVQQIGLYLYDVVGRRVFLLTGHEFNEWEYWRREAFQSKEHIGEPEKIRSLYYFLMTSLPTGVSAFILGCYLKYERSWRYYVVPLRTRWRSIHMTVRRRSAFLRRVGEYKSAPHLTTAVHFLNGFFVVVVMANVLAVAITAYLILSINQKWKHVIREHEEIKQTGGPTRRTLLEARSTLKPLWDLAAATEVGVERAQYANLLLEARSQTDQTLLLLPKGSLQEEINLAMDSFLDAKRAWDLSLANGGYLDATDPQVKDWITKYALNFEASNPRRLNPERTLETMWFVARGHLNKATSLIHTSLEKAGEG